MRRKTALAKTQTIIAVPRPKPVANPCWVGACYRT